MEAFDHLEWTYNGAFEQLFNFPKIVQKFKCSGGCPGGMFKLRFDWYIKLLHIKQLNTAATSSRSFSIFSSNSWRKMSSGRNRTRSVRPSEKLWFHSTSENFGNSNRNFWSNGTRPQRLFMRGFRFLRVPVPKHPATGRSGSRR